MFESIIRESEVIKEALYTQCVYARPIYEKEVGEGIVDVFGIGLYVGQEKQWEEISEQEFYVLSQDLKTTVRKRVEREFIPFYEFLIRETQEGLNPRLHDLAVRNFEIALLNAMDRLTTKLKGTDVENAEELNKEVSLLTWVLNRKIPNMYLNPSLIKLED